MSYIYWLSQVDKEDADLVGSKGANLGELTRSAVPVPDGFVVTSKTYFEFLKENNLSKQISEILEKLDFKNPQLVDEISNHIQDLIRAVPINDNIILEIANSYRKLIKKGGLVAVRSSATTEDTISRSFAGQLDTFINLKDKNEVLHSIKKCWSSLFLPRTLFYLKEGNLDVNKIGVAVIIQKMVQSEVSGVMFTLDPVTNNKGRILIESVWGLGNLIVRGDITPDHYEVAKKSFTIINKKIGSQSKQLVLTDEGTKEIDVALSYRDSQKVPDEKLIELAKIGKKIEDLYLFPQDIEWSLGEGKFFILQSRPVTSFPPKSPKDSRINIDLPVVVKGTPSSTGIAQGVTKVLTNPKKLDKVRQGDVLILPSNNQSFVSALKKASAVVTDKGGETSHAAILSREIGIPCVVGSTIATEIIKSGLVVTVDGSKGIVYKGGIPIRKISPVIANFEGNKEKSTRELKSATKVYVNLVDSNMAAEISQKNVDGVGLLRSEFVMSEVRTHPKKLIEDKKGHVLIDKLTDAMKVACASFDNRPILYRSADFTSHEYTHFKNGPMYDREEKNPAIGYRGALRNITDPSIFNLEMESIKLVRNKYELRNLWLMLPFVRSPRELIEIKKLISANGLHRSSSFKIFLCMEVPTNVILIEKFIEVGIDGISIDLSDLASLLLAADRSDERLSGYFSKADPSILWALEHVLKIAKSNKITSGLVSQSSLLDSNLIDKLVKWGIDYISVSPNLVEKVRETVYESERRLTSRRKN